MCIVSPYPGLQILDLDLLPCDCSVTVPYGHGPLSHCCTAMPSVVKLQSLPVLVGGCPAGHAGKHPMTGRRHQEPRPSSQGHMSARLSIHPLPSSATHCRVLTVHSLSHRPPPPAPWSQAPVSPSVATGPSSHPPTLRSSCPSVLTTMRTILVQSKGNPLVCPGPGSSRLRHSLPPANLSLFPLLHCFSSGFFPSASMHAVIWPILTHNQNKMEQKPSLNRTVCQPLELLWVLPDTARPPASTRRPPTWPQASTPRPRSSCGCDTRHCASSCGSARASPGPWAALPWPLCADSPSHLSHPHASFSVRQPPSPHRVSPTPGLTRPLTNHARC